MKFCEKCNGIAKIMKENDRTFLKCMNCGFSKEISEGESLVTKEKIKKRRRECAFIKDENPAATFPHKCSKCGYDKAELIEKGVMVSDEDYAYFFRCGKCGHVEKGHVRAT